MSKYSDKPKPPQVIKPTATSTPPALPPVRRGGTNNVTQTGSVGGKKGGGR